VNALRRNKDQLEIVGMAAMVLGIVCLVQPLALVLYSFGFSILLVGLIFYIVVSHL
jgi:hypothetical protein